MTSAGATVLAEALTVLTALTELNLLCVAQHRDWPALIAPPPRSLHPTFPITTCHLARQGLLYPACLYTLGCASVVNLNQSCSQLMYLHALEFASNIFAPISYA